MSRHFIGIDFEDDVRGPCQMKLIKVRWEPLKWVPVRLGIFFRKKKKKKSQQKIAEGVKGIKKPAE